MSPNTLFAQGRIGTPQSIPMRPRQALFLKAIKSQLALMRFRNCSKSDSF